MKYLIIFLAVTVSFNHTVSGQEIPLSVETQLEIANAHATERKFAEAATAVASAIALEPENVELYMWRANYHRLAKNLTGVRADVDRAWTLSNNSEDVLVLASRLLDTGETADCVTRHAMADAFIHANSQNDVGYEARFRARTCLGDIAGAFNDISLAAQIAPSKNIHRVNRAGLISRMGDSAEALRVLNPIIETLYNELGEPGTAGRMPVDFELRAWLTARSKIHERNGDNDLALADADKTVELIPNADSLLYRARLYRRLKRPEDAIADLTQAIKDKKGEAFHLYWERGDVLAETGKFAQAISDYEEAIRLMPTERSRIESRIATARKQMKASQR